MSDRSDIIKTEVMCWLRYGKRIPIVATEVGRWNCDVLGVCDTMSVEVEIKTSKADLLRDFTHKSTKHWNYINAKDTDKWTPNYFYFVVPEVLVEEASAILADKAPKIGLAAYTDTAFGSGNNIRIVRKPTKLRSGGPSPILLRTALARMSSELCGTKMAMLSMKTRICESFDKMTSDLVLVAAGAVGALDCEEAAIDLDLRAAQLVMCVEGKVWDDVEDKEKWRSAAKRWLEAQGLRNQMWENESLRLR